MSSTQSEAKVLVITDSRSLRWASVRTEGVVIADHERRRAYAVVGNPIVGLKAEGRSGKKRLPATGKDRIVGIANEGLICMVPYRNVVSDEEVHATIAPVMLARHDTEIAADSDEKREEMRRQLGIIVAGISMGIISLAMLLIVISHFGGGAGFDFSTIGDGLSGIADAYTPG